MVNSSLILFPPDSSVAVSVEDEGWSAGAVFDDSEFSDREDGAAVRVGVVLTIFFPPTILIDRFHGAVDGTASLEEGIASAEEVVEDDMAIDE